MSMKELAGMPAFETFMGRIKEKADEAIKVLVVEKVNDEKSRLQGNIQAFEDVIGLAEELAREEEEEGA